MSIDVTLSDGLKLDGEAQLTAQLRPLTTADIIESGEAAEKLVQSIEGPVLVQSPTRMGAELLRRQIVAIGNIPGPLPLDLIGKLTPEDFQTLQQASEQLDAADMEAAASRGRDDPALPNPD